ICTCYVFCYTMLQSTIYTQINGLPISADNNILSLVAIFKSIKTNFNCQLLRVRVKLSNMPVRQLSSELQGLAVKELNEDPKRISEDLAHIKNWLSKQAYLNARTGKVLH